MAALQPTRVYAMAVPTGIVVGYCLTVLSMIGLSALPSLRNTALGVCLDPICPAKPPNPNAQLRILLVIDQMAKGTKAVMHKLTLVE